MCGGTRRNECDKRGQRRGQGREKKLMGEMLVWAAVVSRG